MSETPDRPPPSALYATYGAGLLSLGMVPINSLLVPLWAILLGMPPSLIGVTIAARAVLPLLYSIHSGVLMDRLGTRPLIAGFAATGIVVALLYPALPWFGAIIGLQALGGLIQNTVWIGAQTQIGQFSRGNPTLMGRFSFFSTFGTFAGPLLAGMAWDLWGQWGGFSFYAIWIACITVAAAALPASSAKNRTDRAPLAARDALPRLADYFNAFRMAAIPAVGLVVMITFARSCIVGIHHSFFPVYLESIGFSGTLIGLLVGVVSLVAGPAALAVGPLTKVIRAHWLLLLATILSIVFMTAPPLFDGFMVLLVLSSLYGFAAGVASPMVLSVLSSSVSAEEQGMSVGLRMTVNRIGAIIVPISMGLIAEFFSLSAAFFFVGGAVMVLTVGTSVFMFRAPGLRGDGATR